MTKALGRPKPAFVLDVLTLDEIRSAAERIRSRPERPTSVRKTPLIEARSPAGFPLYLKAESLQPIGAFKIRGATHMIGRLPARTPGVVAHSSGNHAQAVARAALEAGLKATIVMPSDAPPLKRRRTEADGAEIIEVGPDSRERAERADAEAATRGWPLVPPFDHPDIAAGQGTAALELVEGLAPDAAPQRFYCPTSGGGLLAGCSTVWAALRPDVEIVGVEPDTADDTARSLAAGHRVSVPPPPTIADGLRVRIPGERTFEVLKARVHRIALVSDEAILDAMAWALHHLRLVLEPGGAAGLAAALGEDSGPAAVLLSGGNLEPGLLAEVAARATGPRPRRSP